MNTWVRYYTWAPYANKVPPLRLFLEEGNLDADRYFIPTKATWYPDVTAHFTGIEVPLDELREFLRREVYPNPGCGATCPIEDFERKRNVEYWSNHE